MNSKTRNLTLTALMTAVICILSIISIPLPFTPVPFSLGVLGIMLSSSLLGWKRGLIAVAIFLAIGSVGIPVFAGFSAGVGILAGPTGGYLMGYLLIALFSGWAADHSKNKIYWIALGNCVGLAGCYLCGTIWLAVSANMNFGAALASGVLPFLPFDLVKVVIASVLVTLLRSRLSRLFPSFSI